MSLPARLFRCLSLSLAILAPGAALAEPSAIYLVRHGEKASVGQDPELTAQGQARAQAIATILARTGITAVYSTPTQRTRQTAQPLGVAFGALVIPRLAQSHGVGVALLFPAPGLPKGHVLMGYDQHGCCPMLVDGACSIYDTRPRTCRTYDCRVFPAAGIEADDDKPLIAARARRWVFTHPTAADAADHDAVRAAAVALTALAPGERPTSQTEVAVRAVRSRVPSR